jgi:GWxTD domain-containing protein
MQNKKFIIFLFIFFDALLLRATEFEIYYDFVQFKYSEDTTLLEIHYSYLDTSLTYSHTNSGKLNSIVDFKATFTQQQKETDEVFTWQHSNYKKTEDTNTIYSLFGVKKILLPVGDYKLNLICYDKNNISLNNKLESSIKILKFDSKDFSLSQILLANIIEQENEKSQSWDEMFKKGKYYIIPNPTYEYTYENPTLRFYFEIYTPKNNDVDEGKIEKETTLDLFVTILDGAKRELIKTPIKTLVTGQDVSRILSVPLDLLPTGVYYLRLSLVRKQEKIKVLDEVFKKFYYINQNIPPSLTTNFTEDQLFEMSEYPTMDEETVDKEFKKAKIIAQNVEIDQWNKLTTLQGKQRYLYRFWKIRDTDTSTILNEKKMEFDDLVSFANTYFNYGFYKDGWNTDRGKILLKYGFPTQRDRFIADGTDRAYEDWFYAEIQGGVHFYFVDVMGFGNYILVNSTASNEIQNPHWYDDYVKNKKVTDDDQNQNVNSPLNPIK